METDVVTFEVLKHRFASVADEMMFIVQRSGYSPTTTQSFDFSVAICDAHARMLMQGLAVAGHMGSVPSAVEAAARKFGAIALPGDVYILNDPYEGGMHLPDIFVIKPVFVEGDLLAYTCAVVHHTDVGGRSPGSMAHDSTEIYQEGLRLPPTRLYEEGRPNQAVLDIISRNVRIPQAVLGDLSAQVSACSVGEQRLRELVQDYGRVTLMTYFEALMDYSESIARKIISTWPDGTYHFTDYLDDDGLDERLIELNVTIYVEGDGLTVDYTGSAAQVRGAINCTLSWTKAWTYAAIRVALGADLPNNDGYFRPIKIIVPEGSILNMRHPAACAARGMTGHRLMDLMFGALAQIVPDQIPAASQGGSSTARFGIYDEGGHSSVFYDIVYGTRGGTPRNDGPDGLAEVGANLSNVSVEILEKSFPMRIRRYGLIPDSEGPGEYRGSLSILREWEILGSEISTTLRSDRRKVQPYGLNGGGDGQSSMTYLNPDGENRLLPSKINMRLVRGDILLHFAPSGGGWGDPLDRDPLRAYEDWRLEKASAQHLRKTYGVVVDEGDGEVDLAKTASLRQAIRNKRGREPEGGMSPAQRARSAVSRSPPGEPDFDRRGRQPETEVESARTLRSRPATR